jgi:hypothetical protein
MVDDGCSSAGKGWLVERCQSNVRYPLAQCWLEMPNWGYGWCLKTSWRMKWSGIAIREVLAKVLGWKEVATPRAALSARPPLRSFRGEPRSFILSLHSIPTSCWYICKFPVPEACLPSHPPAWFVKVCHQQLVSLNFPHRIFLHILPCYASMNSILAAIIDHAKELVS